jgi:hypothetical protein
MRLLKFLSAVLFSTPLYLYSQPEITIERTDRPPVIDGNVSDNAWLRAAVINQLYQREPINGEPVSEKTEFLFLYDNNNLYIGLKCYDDPGGITAKELARDVSLGEDDRIQVIFDTFLDGRNGYWFQIGPRGSIGDALVGENGKDFNKSWDGIWDGKARITGEGWEAEMVIPFKTMGFKKGLETWGLKIIRYIKRKSESSYWPATSLNADKFAISDAGRMTGLKNISQGIGLDLVPYATGGFSKKQAGSPDPVLDGGIDAFYQVTPSLKAAVTVNTDFAQTEVDERQINLTRFNLYFPEKRDFFLDGANYFTFGINGDKENKQATQMIPYFSRRTGLDNDGNPVAIKYGGKITGKAGRFNFGLLHIKDDNIWDNPGFSAGRVSVNFGKQSSAGFILTNGNALSSATNTLAGIDLRLARSDFRATRSVIFNIYGVKSFTGGLTGKDFSFGTEINYPNDFLNFRFGYLQTGENFTAGLGFVPRKNIEEFYGSLFLGPRPENSPVLQIKSGIDYLLISDIQTGSIQTGEVGLDFIKIIMLSGDEISFFTDYNYEYLENSFNIFDTISIIPGKYHFWRHRLVLSTAKRRNLWALARLEIGSFYSGTRKDLMLQAGYKVAVPVFIGLEAYHRLVNLDEGDFLARIYRLNFNILFGPNMTWYNYAQYDNQSERIGLQSRFQWIIKPGREIFLTWNSPSIDPMERFTPETYEARMKIKYTIRF